MKKLLNTIVSFSILSFLGCSGSVPAKADSLEPQGKDVSTYLVGDYIDAKAASQKLQEAGFEVVANYESVRKGNTIVFTNEALKAQAANEGKAHVAVMRLFVDAKEKMISFTNPVYFGKAYMQDLYKHSVFQGVKDSITKAFSGLKPSADKMPFDDLTDYHFMIGMPYYDDVDEHAEADNAKLLEAVRSYKKGKSLVFELKISETSTLVGYELGRRTKKFVEKIGRKNAAILPYAISIENGKATSMEAKYYIALSYPLLSMTEFTTIATVPGAIAKDLSKPFRGLD
jgi:hypothetical protein